jgi:GT2 family glycosyltransferase
MTTVSINLLRWNTPWHEIQECIEAVLRSTFTDFSLIYTENFHPSAPSLVADVRARYGADPRLHIQRNESNLGYAGAHNRFFAKGESELLMVLNPDAIVDSGFLEKIVQAFTDAKVAAATGKMLKPNEQGDKDRILDGTGIQVFRTRRARERGQLEVDSGQFDNLRYVFGVSGTAAVYRKSALEAIKLDEDEYFDTDFFAYWEDFDLSWRLRLQGYECVYVPGAIVEHTRAVGVSPGGLRKFTTFVRHHRAFPLPVRQWSWRNHLFAIIKNDFGWPLYRSLPRILIREIGMLAFIAGFSPDTLLSLPEFIRLLPRMLRKRAYIQCSRRIDAKAADLFFS